MSSLDSRLTPNLPGRDRELADVRAAIVSSWSDGCRVILITGEPGIGKTRFVEEVVRSTSEHSAIVLQAACYEDDASSAYRPVIVLLRRLLRQVPGLIESLDSHDLYLLSMLLPELSSEDRNRVERTDQNLEVADAVSRLLVQVAATKPLLVTLDDAQWADDASIVLLRSIVREMRHQPLALLIATHEIDFDPANAFGRAALEFHRERVLRHATLRRLDEAATRSAIESLLGVPTGGVSQRGVTAIHHDAEGVPFFIEELALHLRDSGQLAQGPNGVWDLESASPAILPAYVRGLIIQRLQHLSEATRSILAIASVVGREFEVHLLDELRIALGDGANAPVDLQASLDEAQRQRIVTPTAASIADTRTRLPVRDGQQWYAFAHHQIRDAVYHNVSPIRRRTLHDRVGNVIEWHAKNQRGIAATLARHFSLGTDLNKAKTYALQAAQESEALRAYDDGVFWFRQALDLSDALAPRSPDEGRLPERLTLVLELDRLIGLQGQHDQRLPQILEALDIAKRIRDDRLGEVLRRLAGVSVRTGEIETARAAGRDALVLVRDNRDRLDGLIALGEAEAGRVMGEPSPMLRPLADLHRSEAAYQEALSLAEQLGQRTLWAELAQELSVVRFSMQPQDGGSADDARSLALQSLEAFRQLDNRRGEVTALIALAYQRQIPDSSAAVDPRESFVSFLEEIRRLRATAHRVGRQGNRPRDDALALLAIHLYARIHGWYEIALQRGEQALSTAVRARDARLQLLARTGLSETELVLGRGPRALDHAQRAFAIIEIAGEDGRTASLIDGVQAVLANAHNASGDIHRAIDLARERVARAMSTGLLARQIDAQTQLAELLVHQDQIAEAEVIADATLRTSASLQGSTTWDVRLELVLCHVALSKENGRLALGHAMAALSRIEQRELPQMSLRIHAGVCRTQALVASDEVTDACAATAEVMSLVQRVIDRIGDVALRNEYMQKNRDASTIRSLAQRFNVEQWGSTSATLSAPTAATGILTAREKEVIRLVAAGQSNRDIAEQLFISEKTVARHLTNLFNKIDVQSRTQAAAWAFRNGLV